MKRHLYEDDHDAFRGVVREFVRREVENNIDRWEQQRFIDRHTWLAAGKHGIIGLSTPEGYNGAGQIHDYRYRNVVLEEFAAVGATSLSLSFSLQDDIAIPYIAGLGTDEQKQRWLPFMASGELIGAIAMTEPATGSDLRGITTTANKVDKGWIINGSKTFITSGIQSDLVIVVARTDSQHRGTSSFSLFVVERDMPGFERGRKLDKIGLHGQDTAELSFADVFVPDTNLLGTVGAGFGQLLRHLPLERLNIAAQALAHTEAIFAQTVRYTTERQAFGQPIADFQNTRFELASMTTELDLTRAYVDQAILAYNANDLTVVDAAKAKLSATDTQHRVIDRCLQLHGGYGYMTEYPVARAYQDARIQRIFGGTNEIMKEIIGRDLVKTTPTHTVRSP
ncbi:acyl-CoA dehydrogenase family protein [Rhodococcus baikonurensis]|uniref:acyl-CoA dehydrogenase family protein n=1 Tax=Rhodococcus erythropolis group TaxID=2840174 RepID=UPI000BB2E2B7|nr:acyl-CoA dehydrogenase family protein [Rhodococcus erythropolis]PBI88074.1 Acyl-CoA dehydrogenase [Rhodococcus erythropolis]